MRFNINRPLNCTWVDDVPNTSVNTSGLPANVLRVKWLDKEGYIYYTGSTLNTKITDPSPYQVHINNWMTASIPGTPEAPPLTLTEAKQIKIYFIETLFETKRQAPYAYAIAAGAYSWEATDGTVANMSAMMMPVIYNLIGGLAEGGGENANSLINQINNRLAILTTNVNSNFSSVVSKINAFVTYINNTVLGTGAAPADMDKVNYALFAPPAGINALIPHTTTMANVPSAAVPPIDPAGVTPTGATVQWTPIGQASPVNLTVTEMSSLMGGIAARRTSLLTTKINKTNAVNALDQHRAVIAYDATAGW